MPARRALASASARSRASNVRVTSSPVCSTAPTTFQSMRVALGRRHRLVADAPNPEWVSRARGTVGGLELLIPEVEVEAALELAALLFAVGLLLLLGLDLRELLRAGGRGFDRPANRQAHPPR